jgi:4,5-DOPA dioxygenase extradiol
MDRRAFMSWLASAAAAGASSSTPGCKRSERGVMIEPRQTALTTTRMPVIFQAHGAPMLLDDPAWVGELQRWADALPRPAAILAISAHWEDRPATLGATRAVPLVYDFYGFPRRFYELAYASPGAPALAARVRELFRAKDVAFTEAPDRGLDHGVYVPLMCMYPKADVPVLQVSMPGLDPAELLAFGRALAPLADEGVLVIGSGFLTHNMRTLGTRETPSWATEFDTWVKEALERRDLDALVDFRKRAPGAAEAHPRHEHYAPVVVAAGAAEGRTARPTFPITGYWPAAPAFTKRSVEFG